MDKKSRIGILGGTFNPVHNGHIDLGLKIREAFGLDRLLYVLSAIPPHKKNHDLVDVSLRWQMLSEALAPYYPYLEPCDIEMKRPQDSWTIVTVRQLKRLYPQDRFFFISGSEGFLKIRTWKDYKELLHMLSFIILLRNPKHRTAVEELLSNEGIPVCSQAPGSEGFSEQNGCAYLHTYVSGFMHISSTMIRSRVKQSLPVDECVCPGVKKIMEEKKLYEQ